MRWDKGFPVAWTALAGGLTHGAIGHVRLNYVLYLVPGVLIGSQVGAWLAKKTPGAFLMKLLGWVVVFIGSIILVKAFGLWAQSVNSSANTGFAAN